MKYPVNLIPENVKKYEDFINGSINVINIMKMKLNFNCFIWVKLQVKKDKHVNLLLYKDHFFGIKNLNALLKRQIHRHEKHTYLYEMS